MIGGIISYGTYVPRYRITLETMAEAHKEDPKKLQASLAIIEKTVAGYDEDALTLAVNAARNTLSSNPIDKNNIGAIYIGSESHPYAVKSSSTVVGTALGLKTTYAGANLEFACKGGTAALMAALGAVTSSLASYALAIGSDVAQAQPDDILAYGAAAGSAAFLVGNQTDECIASIDAMSSITVDLPDFWRRSTQPYPEHTGRFTGEPAYFSVVRESVTTLFEKTGLTSNDFDYVVFHQPNGKFVTTIAQRLGFTPAQYLPGIVVTTYGNCYSATTLLGLAAILDQAKPEQRILVASFGSGAGSDALVITTTPLLITYQQKRAMLRPSGQAKKYLSFLEYQRINMLRDV